MRNSRFTFARVIGLVLVLQVSKILAGTNVPVLIWGGDLPVSMSEQALVDPFEKTSQQDFEKIVTRIVGGSLKPVLVFVKDDLCVEDLTEHKDSLGALTETGSLVYRPAVDTPVTVFEKLPYYNCTSEEELDSVSEGQLILTKVVDLDGVPKTFNTLRESSPELVAALTGKSCRYSRAERIKRAADEEATQPKEFTVAEGRILMYSTSTPVLTVSSEKDVVVVLAKNATEEGDGTLESPLQLNFEYTIKNDTETHTANVLLRFPVLTPGYYTPEVLYRFNDENSTLKSKIDLSFPFNFSYHCSQTVEFVNKQSAKFQITDFQVQIDAKVFGDAYDCVGFTSIPIWSGIFVTVILAIIMTWAFTMIMDIRTMDRFDDPKGKTITISASVD